jgi:hypothetical protein
MFFRVKKSGGRSYLQIVENAITPSLSAGVIWGIGKLIGVGVVG